MYRVIKHFCDLLDGNRPYNAGDIFPREGLAVTEARLTELASRDNKQGCPLIELVDDAPKKQRKSTKKAAEE